VSHHPPILPVSKMERMACSGLNLSEHHPGGWELGRLGYRFRRPPCTNIAALHGIFATRKGGLICRALIESLEAAPILTITAGYQ